MVREVVPSSRCVVESDVSEYDLDFMGAKSMMLLNMDTYLLSLFSCFSYDLQRPALSDRADDKKLTTCVTLATDKRIGQRRTLQASTQRELSFGTNGVLISRV
jgi:hypothetical protein